MGNGGNFPHNATSVYTTFAKQGFTVKCAEAVERVPKRSGVPFDKEEFESFTAALIRLHGPCARMTLHKITKT